MKRVFGLGTIPDYKVMYDVLVGEGYIIEVVDDTGLSQFLSQTEKDLDRDGLMKAARSAADAIACELDGTVFIGYDPFLMNSFILKE